jgi:alkylation response protein AidB-like acyl-CoA dehydrogenase
MRDTALLDAVEELAPAIRAASEAIEAERRLPASLVRQLVDAGLFRMMLPRAYGGFEADPLTVFEVVEAVSRVDGSAGWIVMIASGTPAFVAPFLPEDVACDIFVRDPDAVVVGGLAPGGRAVAVDGGYRVTGRWPFGSGCEFSTWLLSGVVIHDGDAPRLDRQGKPVRRLALLPAAGCTVLDTWHVAGLRGTGSHDYTASDLFVPREHTVAPGEDALIQSGPLYAIRFLLVTHAAHALGVARHAIDAFTAFAALGDVRAKPLAQLRAARAEALVSSARAFVLAAMDDAWRAASAGAEVTLAQRVQLRLAITNAVQSAKEAVALLYEAAGGAAIYATSPLERCFRDIHVATQHAIVATPSYELFGRALLGLEVDASAVL